MPFRARTIDAEDIYVLSASDSIDPIPEEWRSPEMYTMDFPVRCPFCDKSIRSIRLIGLTRLNVVESSPLPVKGSVAVCPECARILPVELSKPDVGRC